MRELFKPLFYTIQDPYSLSKEEKDLANTIAPDELSKAVAHAENNPDFRCLTDEEIEKFQNLYK